MKTHIGMIVAGLVLASCSTLPPPATVISISETPAPAERVEPLGNPVIWGGRGSTEPGLVGSGFVATTSQADELVLHDQHGAILQRAPGARLTDFDVAGLPLAESYAVIMGGPVRTSGQTRIMLFRLDRGQDQTVRRWGEVATDLSAPAGFCMRQSQGVVHAVVIDRSGETRQFTLTEGPAGELAARETRRFRVNQPGRGCAIEAGGAGRVYFSHAREGFWMYPLVPSSNAEPIRLRASAAHALPRSTGVSVLINRADRYLLSQDQDRAAFSVWRLGGHDLTWLGRFEVREQTAGGAVRTLAGIDAYGSDSEAFPDGFVVVQDQANDGSPNMKFIDWADVKRTLGF